MGALEDAIGVKSAPVSLEISRSRLRFFAEATGQKDPIYTDVTAARAAGHPDLPAPPTFIFGVEMEGDDPFGWIVDLGIDLRAVLHGEQEFRYHALVYAGDVITAQSELRETYEKRGGELRFLVRVTTYTNDKGVVVAEAIGTTVVRRLSGTEAAA